MLIGVDVQVVIILEELQIPYKTEIIPYGDLKKEPFTTVNPNGRVPGLFLPSPPPVLYIHSATVDLKYIAVIQPVRSYLLC